MGILAMFDRCKLKELMDKAYSIHIYRDHITVCTNDRDLLSEIEHMVRHWGYTIKRTETKHRGGICWLKVYWNGGD